MILHPFCFPRQWRSTFTAVLPRKLLGLIATAGYYAELRTTRPSEITLHHYTTAPHTTITGLHWSLRCRHSTSPSSTQPLQFDTLQNKTLPYNYRTLRHIAMPCHYLAEHHIAVAMPHCPLRRQNNTTRGRTKHRHCNATLCITQRYASYTSPHDTRPHRYRTPLAPTLPTRYIAPFYRCMTTPDFAITALYQTAHHRRITQQHPA